MSQPENPLRRPSSHSFFQQNVFVFLMLSPARHYILVDRCIWKVSWLFSFFFVCCIARPIFIFWLHFWGFLADFYLFFDFLNVFLLPFIFNKHGWGKTWCKCVYYNDGDNWKREMWVRFLTLCYICILRYVCNTWFPLVPFHMKHGSFYM